MVCPGTLTTPGLWDKSQHLQDSAPCVAPDITQPSDFNCLSWLLITDKIKSKPFPDLTPSSLSHHSSSPRQYPRRHTTLHKLNYFQRSPLIILHMLFPLPKTLFHLPLTKSSFQDKLDAISSRRDGDVLSTWSHDP